MKRILGEVPASVSNDLSDYIKFVAATTRLNQKPTAGEILAAAPSTPRRLVALEILPEGELF